MFYKCFWFLSDTVIPWTFPHSIAIEYCSETQPYTAVLNWNEWQTLQISCVIFAVSLSSQTSIPLGSAAVTQVSDPKENGCVLTYHIQDYIFTPIWGSVLYSLEFAWFLYFCLPVLCSNTSCAPDINESCPGRIRSDINSCFLFVHRVYWW